MTEATDEQEQRLKHPWFTICIRPRATIQQIVDRGGGQTMLLWAALGGIVEALNRASERSSGDNAELGLILMLALFVGPVAFSAAEACSFAQPVPLQPSVAGGRAPVGEAPAIDELGYSIRRGTTRDSTSCADIGFIDLRIGPSIWVPVPMTRSSMNIGYSIEVLSTTENRSNLVAGFNRAAHSPTAFDDGSYLFTLAWIDGALDTQEPVEFTIQVRAEDSWGRFGRPCLITIRHQGGRTTANRETGESVACF